jgi:hypothetical protein
MTRGWLSRSRCCWSSRSLAALFAQLAGVIVIDIFVMLSFIGAMALFDIGMIYLGVTIFQRENILTRWK